MRLVPFGPDNGYTLRRSRHASPKCTIQSRTKEMQTMKRMHLANFESFALI